MCDITASECPSFVEDTGIASPTHEMLTCMSMDGGPCSVLHLTDIHIGAEYDAPRFCAKLLGVILRIHPQILNAGTMGSRNVVRLSEADLIKALRRLPAVYAMNCETSLWISPLERATEGEDWKILVYEDAYPPEGGLQEWVSHVMSSEPLDRPLILISRAPFPQETDFARHSAPVIVLHGDVHFQNDQSIWNLQLQCYGALSGIGSKTEMNRVLGLQRSVADYSLLQIWPDGRSECSYRSVSL